jgi:hypothetical protein
VPEKFTIDITPIEDFETAIHVSDLSIEDDVTITNPSDALVARVAPPRVEVEEVSDEDAEGAEGEVDGEADGEADDEQPEEQKD